MRFFFRLEFALSLATAAAFPMSDFIATGETVKLTQSGYFNGNTTALDDLPAECHFLQGRIKQEYYYNRYELGNNGRAACIGWLSANCFRSTWSDRDIEDLAAAGREQATKDGQWKSSK